MSNRVSRFIGIRVFVIVSVFAASISLEAQLNEAGIFVSTSRLPLSTTVADQDSGIEARIDLEESFGLGVSHTRFWTKRLATEVSLQQANSSVRAGIDAGGFGATLGIGQLDVLALSALMQWHMRGDAGVSPWIGGGVAVLDGDLRVPRQVAELADLEDADLGQVASWLLNAGVSFRITERMRIAADLKYTRYKPDSPTAVIPEGEAIHPLLFGAGLRLRF